MADRGPSKTHQLVRKVMLGDLDIGSLNPSDQVLVSKAYGHATRALAMDLHQSNYLDEFTLVERLGEWMATQGRGKESIQFMELLCDLMEDVRIPSTSERLKVLRVFVGVEDGMSEAPVGLGHNYLSKREACTVDLPDVSLMPLSVLNKRDSQAFMEFQKRQEASEFEIPESALVRDIVYVCQGIDGKYIKFDTMADAFNFVPGANIPLPARELLRRLSELGWLFRRVKAACEVDQQTNDLAGVVAQAFVSAIRTELSNHYKLMATLESESTKRSKENSCTISSPSLDDLTLRQLAVWLAQPTQQMKLLAILVDVAKHQKGGALISAIHGHSHHGDPFVRLNAQKILQPTCVPFFAMISKWVFEGDLEDRHDEFFIAKSPSVVQKDLWQKGFFIRQSMLPPFISNELAENILRAGKTINFLRECCNDRSWAQNKELIGAREDATLLQYGQGRELESVVTRASKVIDAHLMKTLFEKHGLNEHLLAIRQYLLFGQGDFIQALMDQAGSELNKSADHLTKHRLSGMLHAAIRASNAHIEEDRIIHHLEVSLIPPKEGDTGWDIFSLEYVLKGSLLHVLSTVLTDEVMADYRAIFNFLWRLRRVDYALSSVWQHMKPNHSVKREATCEGNDALEEETALLGDIRRCHTLRNEMSHFCTNLQYYIVYEVLECSWVEFHKELEGLTNLDQLVLAHEKYLRQITEKALLEDRSQPLARQLSGLFEVMLRFRDFALRLSAKLDEVNQLRLQDALEAKQRTARGNWGRTEADRARLAQVLPPGFAAAASNDLQAISSEYAALLEGFVALLPVQAHIDLRSLQFRLDFSEYYSTSRISTSRYSM